jgi:hypothetical protein
MSTQHSPRFFSDLLSKLFRDGGNASPEVRRRHNRTSQRMYLEGLEDRRLLALTINPTFAANITSDPNAATIIATINRTIADYQSLIADNITVNILFQEGGGLGGSSGGTVFNEKYVDYRAALVSHSTTANDTTAIASLPAGPNDPINNQERIRVPSPLARALGFSAATATDGTITLNTAICNLDRTSVQDATKYDLQAVTAHEIDEILGFGSIISPANNGDPAPTGNIQPDDLFRYDQNGARSFDTNLNTQAYFSIDGGTTRLARFNQIQGGDWGDWFSPNTVPPPNPTPQVQSAFATAGATPNLGVEMTRLDVIGFTLSALNAPVATAAVNQTAVEGTSKAIGLGSFTDPDMAPWGVTVSWGDGSPNTSFFVNTAGSLGTKSHNFAEEGNYTVSVSVTDFTGQSSSTTFSVAVSDPNVIATGGQLISPVEGISSGSVLLATFTDPGGSEPVGDYSADIDWGDGTGTQTAAGSITLNGSTFEVRGTHTYAEESAADHPGSTPYTITITVHHEATAPQTVTSTATVVDPSVIATGLAIGAVEGADTGSILVATFTDPGGPEAISEYSADIDWGDGSGVQVGAGLITLNGNVFEVRSSHTYSEESAADHVGSNPYQIAIMIHHEAALPTTVTSTADVSDPAVTTTGGFAFVATAGVLSAVQTVATFTDPGGADPLGDYTALIDWGDGTAPSAGTITFAGGVYTVQGSHTYAVGLGLPDDFGNTFCDGVPPTFHKPITVTVSHELAPTSQATSDAAISIAPASAHLSGGSLIVVATTADDHVVINPVGNTGAVRVALNSSQLGIFTLGVGGRIIVAGLSGNDDIQVAGGVRLPTVLYGGPGNDRLNGGNGPNILVGCDGNDELIGGLLNDLLIGGDGADRLNGGAGNDILVSANIVNPITHVEDTKFSNLIAALNGGAIVSDDDGDVDVLTGAAGTDTFFYHYQGNLPLDVVTDKAEIAFNV